MTSVTQFNATFVTPKCRVLRCNSFIKHGDFQRLITHTTPRLLVQDQGGMPQIVGHVPLTLSRVFHLFLKHGGQISVEVTGKRRNKGIGLEIPATYSFYHKKPSKVKTLRELIRDKEDKAGVN